MKSKYKFGWIKGFSKEFEPEEGDRIVDYFGIASYTEELANKILPNINTRYHSVDYYFIVIIGIDIVTRYLKILYNGKNSNSRNKAEICPEKLGSFIEENFDTYMQYYEYVIAKMFKTMNKQSFIGTSKIKNSDSNIDLKRLEKNHNLIKKYFLKSKTSYAYDRYKTSLERIKWVNENYRYVEDSILTERGKKILNIVKKELYEKIKKSFKSSESSGKPRGVKISFSKKLYKKLIEDLFPDSQISNIIYKKIKRKSNVDDLVKCLPEGNKKIREIEAIYYSFEPLYKLLDVILQIIKKDKKNSKKKGKIEISINEICKKLEKIKYINIKIDVIEDIDIKNFLKSIKSKRNSRDEEKRIGKMKIILEKIRERIENKKGIRIYEIKKHEDKNNGEENVIVIDRKIFNKFFENKGFKPTNFRLDVVKSIVDDINKSKYMK